MEFLIFFMSLATVSSFVHHPSSFFSKGPDVAEVEKDTESRITNGQDAYEGQFPYQAALNLKFNELSSAFCGGSLISPNWILTAAHCTDGVEFVEVCLGATVRTQCEWKNTVSKKDIIIHAGYNKINSKNDISVMKIPTVSYSSKISAVKLPSISARYSTYTGEYAIASGWGKISDSATGITNDLQWARVQVITNTLCSNTYGSSVVTSSNICISTPNGVSTCNGDSGGPLILESSQEQIGLTSYGAKDGCTLGYPVAFTRLTSYLDWIKKETGVSY